MNLSLFETNAAPPPANPAPPSDVLRRIETKYGPFYLLRSMTDAERANPKTPASDLVAGHFQLVELHDGRFIREYLDGRREPAPLSMSRVLVEDAIRYGNFVEVNP